MNKVGSGLTMLDKYATRRLNSIDKKLAKKEALEKEKRALIYLENGQVSTSRL